MTVSFQCMTKSTTNKKKKKEMAEKLEIKLPRSAGSSKSKRAPGKHLLLLYWLCQSLWLHGSQ